MGQQEHVQLGVRIGHLVVMDAPLVGDLFGDLGVVIKRDAIR